MRIALVNPPFASVRRPTIGLAQLRAAVARTLPQAVVEIVHLNHELARWIGLRAYQSVAESLGATTIGLGDWLFRALAFPEVADDPSGYLDRFLASQSTATTSELLAWRGALGGFLEAAVAEHGLAEADVVGITTMYQQTAAAIALARVLKRGLRPPQVVVGGAGCEAEMGATLARRVEVFDAVFSGPALRSFPAWLQQRAAGQPSESPALRGVFSGQRLAGASPDVAQEVGEGLDIEVDLPLDYDDFLSSLDRCLPGQVQPILQLETARGCWWGERAHCTFCGLNDATLGFQRMPPEQALREIERLLRYVPRVRAFEAVDDIMARDYPTELFSRLRLPPGVSLFYEVKPTLDDAELATLARAGVRAVQPGIESLYTDTLRRLRKGLSAAGNLAFLASCARHGVRPIWNLLVGAPGESAASWEATAALLPRIVHLPPPTGVYRIRFDRFSPYFLHPDAHGLDLQPLPFYGLVYPWPAEDLARFAYYFEDRAADPAREAQLAVWIARIQREIDAWRARWAGKERPVLARRGDLLVDTRGEDRVEHRLDIGEGVALSALERPRSPAELGAALGLSALQAEERVALLLDRGLLFEEGGRYQSLVEEVPGDS